MELDRRVLTINHLNNKNFYHRDMLLSLIQDLEQILMWKDYDRFRNVNLEFNVYRSDNQTDDCRAE